MSNIQFIHCILTFLWSYESDNSSFTERKGLSPSFCTCFPIVLSETKAKLSPEVKLEADSSYKYHFAQVLYSSVPIIDFIHLTSSQIKQEKQKDWKCKHESCTKSTCGLQLSIWMGVKLIFLLCQRCRLDQSWCVQSMHTECSAIQYMLWILTFQSVSHWHLWCLLRQFSKTWAGHATFSEVQQQKI